MGNDVRAGDGGTPPPTEPPTEPVSPRAEMRDAPPFLTWRAIYLVVLGALAVEIALGAWLSVAYR